jgi:hypothetical protein
LRGVILEPQRVDLNRRIRPESHLLAAQDNPLRRPQRAARVVRRLVEIRRPRLRGERGPQRIDDLLTVQALPAGE